MGNSDNESKALGKMKMACPAFNGKSGEYEEWRVKVEDWMLITEDVMKYPGIAIRMGLQGKAMDVAMGMERSVLRTKEGAEKLIEKLDSIYRKDNVLETYSKVRSYLKVERNSKEKIADYLHRYDKLADECKRATGGEGMLDGEVKGCHLLEQANVTEQQKQMILAACGRDKLEYNIIKKVMKRIFESLDREETKEEDWWEEKGTKEKERYNNNEKKWQGWKTKKNPMGIGGKISRCAICGSEFHWARECPENYKNKGRGRAETGKKDEKEQVFVGREEEDEGSYWTEVEAILDTGCNSTLCGEL